MQNERYVSIIISDQEKHASLPRLLQSIARQSTGLEHVEIIVVSSAVHPASSILEWKAITGTEDITLHTLPAESSPALARNHGAEVSHGDLLLFLRPDFRLDPKYLTTALDVFADNPEADIIYTDYIRFVPRGSSGPRPGMVQLPDYEESILAIQNFIGPATMLRRDTFMQTDGFRDNTIYREWDLWVQAATHGGIFHHINYPLASCEHAKITFKGRAEDGRNKAMVVINNQSFYHMHQVRWALAYLRGEAWAEAFSFMTIPSPMEVTRMLSEFQLRQMGGDILAQRVVEQFDEAPDSVKAVR